ncbi:MAG: hypothetical protein U0Q15_00165 [Kineosporiaceae bacterium]
MRPWITIDADVRCDHKLGRVDVATTEDFVFVQGRTVVVGDDPTGRPIGGCPNVGAAIKPCQHTLQVAAGRSTFVRIGGRPVVRADLEGITDGTPPGTVRYRVLDPGQVLVAEQP